MSREKFAKGQKLVVWDSKPLVGKVNKNFEAFEELLKEAYNKAFEKEFEGEVRPVRKAKVAEAKKKLPFPDPYGDMDWDDPAIWTKNSRGEYSLNFGDALVPFEKKNEIKENLIHGFAPNAFRIVNKDKQPIEKIKLNSEWNANLEQRWRYNKEKTPKGKKPIVNVGDMSELAEYRAREVR